MTLYLAIFITAISMEGVAWFMHKYIMHTFGWFLHEDHHIRTNHDSFVERNDAFFVLFAILSISAFLIWKFYASSLFLGIGIGIFIYGVVYFFIHDLFIHQRIKVLRNTNNPYLKAIRRAHKMHHKHTGKEDGECFGMLWVPMKYYKEEFSK